MTVHRADCQCLTCVPYGATGSCTAVELNDQERALVIVALEEFARNMPYTIAVNARHRAELDADARLAAQVANRLDSNA